MKRSKALAPLSRQHHQGLFAAQRLKRASAATAAEARQAFLDFYDREGREHFRIEEEIILPGFAKRGEHDHAAVVSTLTDHVLLRALGQQVAESELPDLELLQQLGGRLEAHIRHEERVLFPLIEATLPAAELEDLGAAVLRAST